MRITECPGCGGEEGYKRYGSARLCWKCYIQQQTEQVHIDVDKLRLRRRLRTHAYRARLRVKTLTALGGQCACCGERSPQFLVVHHKHGGGRAHHRATGVHTFNGASKFYAEIKREGYPKDKYEVLCYNCHMAITNYGSCPHSQKPRPFEPEHTDETII